TSAVRPTPSGYASAASSARSRSTTTIRAPSAESPSAIARPIPCAAPVTTATLPSSCPISARSPQGRERGRDEDPALLGVHERLHTRDDRLPALVGLQPAPSLLALGVRV